MWFSTFCTFLRGPCCREAIFYGFNAFWPSSATSHTITTVIAAAKRYSLAVKMPPVPEIGRNLQGLPRAETKNFHMAALLTAKPPGTSARPLRIDPHGGAVQKYWGNTDRNQYERKRRDHGGPQERVQCSGRARPRKRTCANINIQCRRK